MATETNTRFAGPKQASESDEAFNRRAASKTNWAGPKLATESDGEYEDRVTRANANHEGPSMYLRGEGGYIWEFWPPLNPEIAAKLASGKLTRVNQDGTTWQNDQATVTEGSTVTAGAEVTGDTSGDAEVIALTGDTPERPTDNAALATWKTYAVQTKGGDPAAVDGMTKPELIKAFG